MGGTVRSEKFRGSKPLMITSFPEASVDASLVLSEETERAPNEVPRFRLSNTLRRVFSHDEFRFPFAGRFP